MDGMWGSRFKFWKNGIGKYTYVWMIKTDEQRSLELYFENEENNKYKCMFFSFFEIVFEILFQIKRVTLKIRTLPWSEEMVCFIFSILEFFIDFEKLLSHPETKKIWAIHF